MIIYNYFVSENYKQLQRGRGNDGETVKNAFLENVELTIRKYQVK